MSPNQREPRHTSSPRNVAKWDGLSWSAVGLGPSYQPTGSYTGLVNWLAGLDDGGGPAIFAGVANNASGVGSTDWIEKWDGSSWAWVDQFPGGPLSSRDFQVYDVGSGPALYAIGHVATLGIGSLVTGWDGTNWGWIDGSLVGYGLCLEVYDSGNGPTLFVGGQFTGVRTSLGAPITAAANIAAVPCPSTITLTSTQPGSPGTPTYLANANLTPQREYYNIFSLDTCPGGPGSGPLFGLCLTTMPNYTFILDQLQAPLGTPLFHFIAQQSYTIWGGYQVPPMTVDGIVFDYTGGVIGAVSPVTRITVQ